jgi:hypothetical protein
VLGTALITWLKNAEDEIEVAKENSESCAAAGGRVQNGPELILSG